MSLENQWKREFDYTKRRMREKRREISLSTFSL
uniref:Uncharacterized protein n=1 Tax=Rhizophora mucronata TaxID=61149 RepID=A0A2P2IZM9_RHIMU